MKISELRKLGEKLGREGLAVLALEIAKEIAEDGSYKGAIHGAGKMQAIVKACTFDEYWGEKATGGVYSGEDLLFSRANAMEKVTDYRRIENEQ